MPVQLFGVISASAGATGVIFSIQQLEIVKKKETGTKEWGKHWKEIVFTAYFYFGNVMCLCKMLLLTNFTVWLRLHHGCPLIGCSGRAPPLNGWHWGEWERRRGADLVWLVWLWKDEIWLVSSMVPSFN